MVVSPIFVCDWFRCFHGYFLSSAAQNSQTQECCVPRSASVSLSYPFLLLQTKKNLPNTRTQRPFFDFWNSFILYKWPLIFFNQHTLASHVVRLQSGKNTWGAFHGSPYLTSLELWKLKHSALGLCLFPLLCLHWRPCPNFRLTH